jgi:acyl-CoA hydrolase
MSEQQNYRDDLYSKAVRAGKRTYFFDVRCTKGSDLYLTITESKRRFADDGKVFYEKHKLFLYKEDFEKFSEGLDGAIDKIKKLQETGEFNSGESEDYSDSHNDDSEEVAEDNESFEEEEEVTDISFEDLGKD